MITNTDTNKNVLQYAAKPFSKYQDPCSRWNFPREPDGAAHSAKSPRHGKMLGRSWVVRSGVISTATTAITHTADGQNPG